MKTKYNKSFKYIERSLKTANFRNCVQSLDDEDLIYAFLLISKKKRATTRNCKFTKSDIELRALDRQQEFLSYINKELQNRNIIADNYNTFD
jgi:hypothetical protein